MPPLPWNLTWATQTLARRNGLNGAACNVPQLHAANAEQAGDIEQATKDIAALRRQADQLVPNPMDMANILAIMADNRAMAAIQFLLPRIETEQQLDALILPDRQWYRDAGRRCARASSGIS